MDFYFVMYYSFVHTDPYEHVGKIQKKEKKTKHIYIADSHNYILIKKKERNTPQNILLYLHEKLVKINNK